MPGTASPVSDVRVSNRAGRSAECRGIVDTGASITAMPPSVVKSLDL